MFGQGVVMVEGAGSLIWPLGSPRRQCPGPKVDRFSPKWPKMPKGPSVFGKWHIVGKTSS